MFWWQWVLIIVTIFGFLFFYLIFFGGAFMLRVFRTNPTLPSYTITEEGRFINRILKPVGMSETDWRRKTNNPAKVGFKYYPQGIGKAIYDEHNDNDWISFDSPKGDKRLILFGLKNIDKVSSLKIKMLSSLLNEERIRSARLNQEKKKLEVRLEDVINDRLTQMKKQAILPITTKKK
jgi:Fe-S cluster biosynthesis and repair protein YggX